MATNEKKADRREWDSIAPKQAGEPESDNVGGAGADLTKTPRSPMSWVNSAVWTPRMLAALEGGVKGDKWFSLMDKVYSEKNLHRSFEAVKANKGSAGTDHQTIKMFEQRRDENLGMLGRQLRDGSYRPQPVRRVLIPKPGSTQKRPLGIPAVRDRVVQAALLGVIEPIFEREFAEHSYGFRPLRGCKDALRRVQHLLDNGYTWAVDADLKSYFDTIDHEILMSRVEQRISDGKILSLIRQFLQQGVMEEAAYWEPQEGTPQGGVISPLLSNIYLNPLDHLMAAKNYEMVRYADDFVILCRDERQANQALEQVRRWVEESKLTLHPEKTRLVDVTQPGGFDFLGYHFERDTRTPRLKSLMKFKDSIRMKTKRTNGHSMQCIIADANRTLRGWYNYFKHARPAWIFERLDRWTRVRLRSLLRRRMGARGLGRGSDHQRWPNDYFTQIGLFSLKAAREAECQSVKR